MNELIEQGSGNVYADLGFPDAEEMFIKSQLAGRIAQTIKEEGLTQREAAELIGVPQPKLSRMLRGHFHGVSEAKMLECLNRLGQDVQIVVKKAPRSHASGQTCVVFA